jgi:hypothetical protein
MCLRKMTKPDLNPSNTELNPICHLLTLLGAHHILHVSRIRVKVCHPRCVLCKVWRCSYVKTQLNRTYLLC